MWGLRQGRTGAVDTLLLIGHTDTVHTRGWKERWAGSERESPFSGAVADGAVWGRGASDLKAGLCMTLEAVRTLDRAGIRSRSHSALCLCRRRRKRRARQRRQRGSPRLQRAHCERGCAATEHGDLRRADNARRLCRPHGVFPCDIRVLGKSAYFGVPELGVDALKGAHAVLEALWRYSAELSATARAMRWSDPGSFCRLAFRAAATSRFQANAQSA